MRIASFGLVLAAGLLTLSGCAEERGEVVIDDRFEPPTGTLTVSGGADEKAPPVSATVDCADEPDFCRGVLKDGLQPVPKDTACTMIYGGPEVATVVGEVDGKKVNLSFSRENGCEMGRYDALATLVQNLNTPLELPISPGSDV